jgi:gliding motility-associated-like protein
MNNCNLKYFIILFFSCLFIQLKSQTLIMNEVSNGANGSEEYVEFVVISNVVTYTCSNSNPPCIDIRGWIFDDNSGYHGTNGIAAGAIRFSQDPLWACVPLGTIILIYNSAAKNPAIGADDVSMTDGNCKIISGIFSPLFELNATTPGASACSYPPNGWVPTTVSSWTSTALANGGDCARIVNLAGCEVFSVCYGTNTNLNNQIYFPNAGGQKVYYFNDNDPSTQLNWTEGDATTNPGDQTPGEPNNPANAAYIAQFNNGCQPISQTSVSSTFTNASCSCDGSATANATGSIGPYTYEWFDANFNSIGQTNATATGLCSGIYKVIANSHIGCSDTSEVTIGSSSTSSISVNSATICSGNSSILTASTSVSGGNFLWSPGGQTSSSITVSPNTTTTYSVTYTTAGCSSFAQAFVTVISTPTLSASSATICSSKSATLNVTGAPNYLWNTSVTSNSIIVSPATTTNYTVSGNNNGCSSSLILSVTVNSSPTITVNSASICPGNSITISAIGANSYTWSTGSTNSSIISFPSNSTSYTVTGEISGCLSSAVSNIFVYPTFSLSVNSPTICEGETATLTCNGATNYIWNNGLTTSSINVTPTNTTAYSVIGTTGVCSKSITTTVVVNLLPSISIASQSICTGQTATLTASGATTYSWNNGATSNSISESPLNTTSYSVTGTNNGCSNTATTTLSVIPAPDINFYSDNHSGCSPVCVQFSDSTFATSTNIVSWNWNFNDGNLSFEQNPYHCFEYAGLYSINLTIAFANGCVKSLTKNNFINVFEKPIAEFNYLPQSVDILDPTIQFSNQSANATTFSWNFGDQSTSTLVNPMHTFSNEGLYTVVLTASSGNGCESIVAHDIIINGIFTFYAPNTFTPNDDGVNNIFYPMGVGWETENYQLDIFDRWGNHCFSTNDIYQGWDGKANNGSSIAQVDTYTWKVTVYDTFKKRHNFVGKVTLIK